MVSHLCHSCLRAPSVFRSLRPSCPCSDLINHFQASPSSSFVIVIIAISLIPKSLWDPGHCEALGRRLSDSSAPSQDGISRVLLGLTPGPGAGRSLLWTPRLCSQLFSAWTGTQLTAELLDIAARGQETLFSSGPWSFLTSFTPTNLSSQF